jgi:hypothetical protein
MASRLSDRLLAVGIAAETVQAAIARQAVYGGALDTAVLEMDVLDEPALWAEMGVAAGLPLPEAALCESPVKCVNADGSIIELDGAWSERARAVPVGVHNGALQVLCGEPVAHAELAAASVKLGVPFTLYIVPEVRLAAVRQAVFDRPMPPRLLRLFARIAGAEPVRRWQTSQIKPVAIDEKRGVEVLPRRTPVAPAAAVVAPTLPVLATLPTLPTSPAAPTAALKAASAVASAAGKAEVPKLIGQLVGAGAVAARSELVKLTGQDFGTKVKRWQAWWEKHHDADRVEWLFEGLSHKEEQVRATAERELRALTGEYFGYHFDLPRRAREHARERWQAWWYESGRARKT